jgi:hypothetical protein
MKPTNSSWPFEDPPNVATFTTADILERGCPILLVTHDAEDGAWQFLSGRTSKEEDARIVALRTAVEQDPSIAELADLPVGWRAWRGSVSAPWVREPNSRQDR